VAETERLRLRRLRADDAAFLLELLNQPSWLEFIGDRNVRSAAQALDYLEQRIDAQFERYGYGMWGVELREHARPATHRPRQPAMGQPRMRQPAPGQPAVDSAASGQPIGLVGLVKRDYLPEPDLGFALLDAYAGRGLAYEAACAVLPLARARGLTRLLAITDPDNRRSIGLLQRLGFELEGPQAVPGATKLVQRYSKDLGTHER
jgi:[ribosomal protein S5]-alanine N-acetyltransferase